MSFSLRAWGCAVGLSLLVCGALSDIARAEGKKTSDVQRGQKLFERVWQSGNDAEAGGDGLGPLFNARSCVACHFLGGVGGAGPTKNNVALLSAPPTDPAVKRGATPSLATLHPAFASGTTIVLHHFSNDPVGYLPFHQKLIGLKPPTTDKPGQRAIAVRAILRKRGDGPIKTFEVDGKRLMLSQRNTPPLFGLGLIDSISKSEIEEVAVRQTKENPAVTGRFVGRFGWRGQVLELNDFVRGACATELGLQVSTQAQAVDPIAKAANKPAGDNLDLTDRQCDDLTAFVARLPAPQRFEPADPQEAASINNGEHLFATVGCTVCHRPTLAKVAGLYSDLLLHDMGPSLADPAPAPAALPSQATASASAYTGSGPVVAPAIESEPLLVRVREWKTPPLWGLRDSGPYLHDGRAKTVEEAISLHGGEAASSVDQYLALPADVRSRLLAFLATLAAPGPSSMQKSTATKPQSPASTKSGKHPLPAAFVAALE